MKTTSDNPAGRLYQLLTQARSLRGNGYFVWARVFGMKEAENEKSTAWEFQVLKRLMETQYLVDDLERALNETNADGEPYLATLPEIRKALQFESLNTGNYEVILNNISIHAMSLLALASDNLSRRHMEPNISDEDLSQILSDVRALFEEIQKTEFGNLNETTRLRTFILDSLTNIEQAIQNFRIRGIVNLEDALIRISGEMFYRYGDIPQTAQQNETTTHWFERFKEIVVRVDSLIRFADKGIRTIEAGSRIIRLLSPGG